MDRVGAVRNWSQVAMLRISVCPQKLPICWLHKKNDGFFVIAGEWALDFRRREGKKAKTPPTLTDKLHLKGVVTRASSENLYTRRLVTLSIGATWVSTSTVSRCLIPLPVKAEELAKDQADGGDNGVLGAIKNLFDPDEKTKSGKVLPKAYLKAAREVVKTLRESLEGDTSDNAKFRRSADAAKESIREYLNGWRGQKAVVAEESYAAIEKAIRSLASFYSKAGPSASMSKEVKSSILDDLNIAEASL